MGYKLHWSEEAVANLEGILEGILESLSKNWTNREIENFKKILGLQLDLIIKNPYMFPVSDHIPRCEKQFLASRPPFFTKLRIKPFIWLIYTLIEKTLII